MRRAICVLLAAMLLLLAACGGQSSGTAETADAEPSATPVPTPTATPLPDPDPERAAVYEAYRDGVKQVLTEFSAPMSEPDVSDYARGTTADVDGDGWPELLVLYSPNGSELHAMLGMRIFNGAVRYLDVSAGMLGQGVKGDILYGELDGAPTLHVVLTREDGGRLMGSDSIVEMTELGMLTVHTLNWDESLDGSDGVYFADGVADKERFDEMFDSIQALICSSPSEDILPLAELVTELEGMHDVYARTAE